MPLIATALVLVGAELLRLLAPHRRSGAADEVRFLGAIAAELRAGTSIRSALVDAAAGQSDETLVVAGRIAASGGPLDDIAAVLNDLPINGPRASAALRVVGMAGGRSADVFSRLADRAAEAANLVRERRALTTQARLSALVVGGLPVLSLLAGGAGKVRDLVESGPGGAAVAAIGLTAQAVGSFLVWRMAAAR